MVLQAKLTIDFMILAQILESPMPLFGLSVNVALKSHLFMICSLTIPSADV
jgi:hypothetical protein